MRIVVTGSSGQIGSYVADHAAKAGHEAHGLDRRPGPRTKTVADVRDDDALGRILAEGTGIVHCAAQVSVQASLEAPTADADVNIGGTVAVLEAARRHDAEGVVLVSSAAVYGDPEAVPVAETHPLRPESPYGMSKVAAEGYGGLYARLYGLRVAVVRPFNVYSVRQDPQNPYTGVMSRFADRVRAGMAPVVAGDGSQTRDFVHAEDVADWLVRLATGAVRPESRYATMNLGSGHETSIRALAERFLQAGDVDLPLETMPRPAGEIDRSVADIGRAAALGWSPRVGLDEGIRLLVEGRERDLGPQGP